MSVVPATIGLLEAYRREATVIYPPVDVARFTPDASVARGDYYVTASRLVPYKCVDVIVEAFRGMPDRRLVVVGDGPARESSFADVRTTMVDGGTALMGSAVANGEKRAEPSRWGHGHSMAYRC